MLTVGSCFAGVGGFDLGLALTGGFTTLWHSEIHPPANRVMAARFPDSQPMGDMDAITYGLFPPPPVDVLAGGPPCQGISTANSTARTGLADPRSNLFHTYAALIDTMRPRWVVMEQVPGLLTSGPTTGADYATVRGTFRELGYAIDTRRVNTLTYAPQQRERLIFVGHSDQGAAASALLPLTKDGARHPDQSRAPRRPPAREDDPGAYIYRKSRRPASDTDAESWVTATYTNTLTRFDVGTGRATVIVLDELELPRVLTPEEWEQCHGFPPGWTQAAGGAWERCAAIGNAVSPPIAQRVGHGILAAEGHPCATC